MSVLTHVSIPTFRIRRVPRAARPGLGMAVALLVSTLPVTPLSAQDEPEPELPRTPATHDARPEDVESIDAIVAALYDVISGPAGDARDWDRMRSLFHPGALMVPTGMTQDGSRSGAVVWSVEDYIRLNEPFLAQQGFFEEELRREVIDFGHIAHVFSSYAARQEANGPVFMRGLNSLQLLDDGTRWWIVSLMWNPESPRQPLPDRWSGKG